MRLGSARETFDRLTLTAFYESRNARLGDVADGAAGHDGAEMFGFLLGHEVLVRIA